MKTGNEPEITILEAGTDEDFKLIAELAREIWTEHYSGIISSEQIEYMLQKYQSPEAIGRQIRYDGYKYFTAYDNGEAAAYGAVVAEPENSVFLSKLYVRKEHRRKGIARILINHALKNLALEGSVYVYLTVNRNNIVTIASYRRLGFDIEKKIVTDIGNGFVMDDYVMSKNCNK